MKLFEKLDAAYARDPNPDQIVLRLNGSGWVKCAEISENFFEENKAIPFVIGVWDGNEFRSASGIGPRPWYFTHCAYSWREFRGALRSAYGGHYWMISKDEYVHGDYPCRV